MIKGPGHRWVLLQVDHQSAGGARATPAPNPHPRPHFLPTGLQPQPQPGTLAPSPQPRLRAVIQPSFPLSSSPPSNAARPHARSLSRQARLACPLIGRLYMTAISPDPTKLQLLPTFISHTLHLPPSTPFHTLPPSHTLALTHQNGHRSRPLDLQAVLPGNLTLCRSLSTRRPFAGFRANLETHFLFLGSLFACRVS